MTGDLRILPANNAPADDLNTVFELGDPSRCRCQWFKIPAAQWRSVAVDERARRLREQAGCGRPGADETTGLVAYLDGEPVGWCAVEPRTADPRLLTARVPWAGRNQDRSDESVRRSPVS